MSGSKISLDEVKKVANLARLKLTNDQLEAAQAELNNILAHVEDIAGLDLDDVPPTEHAVEIEAALRPYVVVPSLDRSEALSQAPDAVGDGFGVSKVMEADE